MNEPLRITRRQREIRNRCVGGRFWIDGERSSTADFLVRAGLTERRAARHGLADQDLDALNASTRGTGPKRKYVEDQLTSHQIAHCPTIEECVNHLDASAAP